MKFLFILITLLTYANVFALDECSEFQANLPKNYVSGYISVPEDWNNPAGTKINVFYYGKKDPKNALPKIAFFNGGPSRSSHGSFDILESHPESQNINFIYIDQRGTGCSDPYPEGISSEVAKRLTHYTTRSIVNDAEAIRKTLVGKNGKWKIFGQSYGSMIVHRYVSIYPESIDTAYAHGFAIMTDQVEWIKERILSQKRVVEDYFREYPQDRNDLEKIKDLISQDYCFLDNGISLCGPTIMDILRHPLGFHDSWEEMHWWIENLAQFYVSQPSMMQGFSNFYFTDFTHDSLPSLVINKVEITKGPSDREECIEAFSRLKAEGDNPDLWPINECRVLIELKNNQFNEILSTVKSVDALTISSLKSALDKNPNLRFYLYSGQKDVFVPVATFLEEKNKLGTRLNYQIFSGSGHEGFHTEQQIWDDLLK